MEITFTGRNIDATPALKTFTKEKMERLPIHSKISKFHVTFHVENLAHIAEATLHVNGTDIHASAESKDMYAAIDMLTDKLQGQLTKLKEKQSDHR